MKYRNATFRFLDTPRIVPKLWGYEVCICNVLEACHEKGYACKLLNLVPYNDAVVDNGVNACSIHYHMDKTETFFVLKGVLFLQIFLLRPGMEADVDLSNFEEPKDFVMYPGTGVTLEAQVAHRFWTRDVITTVIEASTLDDAYDSYRLVGSGRGQIMDDSIFMEIRPNGIPPL
jgi:mannose-6-phosphate isomerase-like protein (cupin superfamily)